MLFPSTITASLAIFIATTSAAPSVDNTPAQNLKTRAVLGTIDVEQACKDQYPILTFADRKGGECNDWRCFEVGTAEKPLGTEEFTVDMDKFCKTHFGDAARAVCTGKVFDWQCQN